MNDSQPKDDAPTANLRIRSIRPISTPREVITDLPCTCSEHVIASRRAVHDILTGSSDRLIAVVGPCSIHDQKAAGEYAQRLAGLAKELADDLLVIMRVYFEKPRTSIGWKGLINDPDINDTFAIDKGLRLARSILLQINELGLPCGTEMLDVFTPQYFADLLSWGAIGARTTESQSHRELASGLSFPVGFKNGTSGSVKVAVNAVHAARSSHHFLCITEKGESSIGETAGNEDTHIILRGGVAGPNYQPESVGQAAAELTGANLPGNLIMIDCSHANSAKDYRNQPKVGEVIGAQIAGGDRNIIGIMIESNINEGNQSVAPLAELKYGVSITDSCVGWEDTEVMLRKLAGQVAARRSASR